jgi:hypothetical protein
MATITGSCDNSRYTLTCEWSSTQNVSANSSTVTAIVYLNGNGYTTTSSYWTCVINGTTVTSNKSASIGGKTELGRRTWTVSHDSSGKCSVPISFSYSNGLSSAGTYTTKSGSGSSTVSLPTIPRVSSFTLNKTSCEFGQEVTVTISKASSSFTHDIHYKLGSINVPLVGSITGTSYKFTPALTDMSELPNATSGTVTITVYTKNGNTIIGSASKTLTVTVPSSVVPTVGISIAANNTLNGTNISNKTTFTVKPINAKGVYGSTIKSYTISGEGLSTTSSSGGTSKTMNSGKYTYTVKVTDSRGRTGSASQTVTVHSYDKPTLSFTPYRADVGGTPQDNGEYIYSNLNYTISNPNNGNANTKKYRLLKKTANSSTWSTVQDWVDLPNYQGTTSISFGGGFSILSSYDVQVEIKDTYNTTSLKYRMGTANAVFNIEEDGVGIGKIWEQGALDVGGDIYGSGGLVIQGSSRVGSGEYIYGTGNDGSNIALAFVNQTNNSSEFGTSTLHTTIKSGDNPTWYSGTDSKSYSIWTDKNCSMSSNNNCQTWRFPNGMQVSIMKVYGTWNITTAWGSVFSSPHIAGQSFNIAFLEAPKVMINAYNDGGTTIMVCQTSAPTTTSTGAVYLWKPTTQTGIRTYIEYIAIGRWK